MKSRALRILIILTLTFTWLGYRATPAYALCSGSGCNGLNPNTMGCGADAVTSGSVKILSDGGANQSFVETRKSSACDAKWARATNKSGGARYAAASLRLVAATIVTAAMYHHPVRSAITARYLRPCRGTLPLQRDHAASFLHLDQFNRQLQSQAHDVRA